MTHIFKVLQSDISGVTKQKNRKQMVAQNGTSRGSFGGTMVDPSLWKPGEACPVVACQKQLVAIRDAYQFKRHWIERHERLVAVYKCSLCAYSSKRKRDLDRHFRIRHSGFTDIAASNLSCALRPNKSYVDPSPLTQEDMFGSRIADF